MKTEIKLSKGKLALKLAGSILFVAIGAWFVINPSKFKSVAWSSSEAIFIAGLMSILLFGFVGFFIFKKIFDDSPGLIISDDGIVDNSNGISAGEILWSDVVKITAIKVASQDMLVIVVDNPELYINRQSSVIRRKAMKLILNMYGSPINISAGGLQCNFQELKSMLDGKKLSEFNSSKQSVY